MKQNQSTGKIQKKIVSRIARQNRKYSTKPAAVDNRNERKDLFKKVEKWCGEKNCVL